jgi:hypothetical protein
LLILFPAQLSITGSKKQEGCTADASFAHHDFSLAITALKTHALSLWVTIGEKVCNSLLSSDARYRFVSGVRENAQVLK